MKIIRYKFIGKKWTNQENVELGCSAAHDSAQIAQPVERGEERFVLFREMEPDDMVDVLVKEGAARHAGHADLLCHLDAELHVRLALFHIGRDIGQHKIGALGVCKGDIEVFHAAGEDYLHMGVVVAKLAVVFIRHLEAHNSGLHQRRSRADGVKVVVLLDPVHDGLRSDRVAEPPAGDGVGLGQARAADCPLPHAGKRGM